MSRARDNANLGAQAGSGLDASDITTGVLPSGVTGGSGLDALSASSGALLDSELASVAAVKATTGTFLTADQNKLDGIEASADVTDATNVTAAGALMDSELAGIAAVKATTGTFLSADESKLDGIEASADVTDSTNVTAAGALMDSECTDLAAVKATEDPFTAALLSKLNAIEASATADQTRDDINALDITELGTVTSGVLEDAVTYRNINQDLASTDSPTFNNLGVSQVNGNTHYRSNFVSCFPSHASHAVTIGTSTWTNVCDIQGQWSTGNSHLEEWMTAPGAGFTEAFYLTVVGGVGSGSAVLNFRLLEGGTSNLGIASTHVVQGWHGYASQFAKTVVIGTFNGVSLRTLLTTGSNKIATVQINNTGASGYSGCSRVLLEQRIYFS